MSNRKPKMVVVDGVRYRAEDAPKPTKVVPVVAEVETDDAETGADSVPTGAVLTTGANPAPADSDSAGPPPADGVVSETPTTADTSSDVAATEVKEATVVNTADQSPEAKKEPAKKAAPTVRNKARQPADAGNASAASKVETKQ